MNVDLIKALDARGAEAKAGEGQGGDAEFPEVFESTLEAAGSDGTASDGAKPNDESGGRDAPAGSAARSERVERENAEASGEENDEAAKAEAAAESGAIGGEAAQLAERVRIQAAAERGFDVRAEASSEEIGASRARSEEGLEAGEPLDDEQVRETLSRLEAEGLVAAADGDEASATADAAVTGAVASGVPQAAAGTAEGPPETANEVVESREDTQGEAAAALASSDAREEDSGQSGARDQETQRAAEASLFERAAEGSPQAGVDPNLRQAIANAEEAQRAPEVAAVEGATAVASPVAGQVTETTTTATPGSPQPVAASEAISVQTEWLATRGGGTARLVLHPPELGEIAIRVSLRGGAVDVVIVAQEAVAQGVAEEQSERLSQAFANRDLRLENFEVRRGTAEDLPNGDTGRFAESERDRDGGSNEQRGAGQHGVAGAEGADEAPLAVPRILTRAPETGVDLRI